MEKKESRFLPESSFIKNYKSVRGEKLFYLYDGLIQVELPFEPVVKVNAFLLRHRSGKWTVVDAGYYSGSCVESWKHIMSFLGIVPQDIEQLLVTHMHPDHAGMAGWFSDLGVDVVMHPKDIDAYRATWEDRKEYLAVMERFFCENGVPQHICNDIVEQLRDGEKRVKVCRNLQAANLDDRLELDCGTVRFITAQGHTDGQIMLWCEEKNFLISGDQILLNTFPILSFSPFGSQDPLGDYFTSIKKLKNYLNNNTKLFPGHGSPFQQAVERIDLTLLYHSELLEETEQRLDSEKTAFQLFEETRGNCISTRAYRVGIGEIIARSFRLEKEGKLARFVRNGTIFMKR